jgi:cell division protein FtsB
MPHLRRPALGVSRSPAAGRPTFTVPSVPMLRHRQGRRPSRRSILGRLPVPRPILRRPVDAPPLARRRARALVLGAAVFAVVVLASALPVSTLLAQRHQLASTAFQIERLQVENRSLGDQARRLSTGGAVTALARRDYGLVAPGQTAYDILPAPGPQQVAAPDSGHVPLEEAPVEPGSPRSQELLGVGTASSSSPGTAVSRGGGAPRTTAAPGGAAPAAGAPPAAGGFWSRVVHTLEFWS